MSSQENGLRIAGFLNYELESINYITHCIQKTNQFSAKFILQKLLSDQKKHFVAIERDVRHLDTLMPEVVISVDDLYRNLETKFELQTLNFIEATRLAIAITEHQLSVYNEYLPQKPTAAVKEVLMRLLKQKKTYYHVLQKEYERLRY